ncbi:transmembrane protein 238a isoform X1 [Gasterosteus aculeatus]
MYLRRRSPAFREGGKGERRGSESRRAAKAGRLRFCAAGRTKKKSTCIMAFCDGLSHCKLALAFAVLMDLLGGTALLVGVFAPLEIQGRDFGDLLVYTGALFVVMSLAGWVLWYSGNIEGLTSKRELGHISSAVDRLARNLSRKIRSYKGHL